MKNALFGVLVAAILFPIYLMFTGKAHQAQEPIRVGALFRTSGSWSAQEIPRAEAVRMAIDEINHLGLLDRNVEIISVDLGDEPEQWAAKTRELIARDVSVIFAGFTSDVRKAVLPVIEEADHLLFYALFYEGQESSPNVVYTGATANQHFLPGLKWAVLRTGKRVYMVGTDYVFPRTANQLMGERIKRWHGEVLGEAYLNPDSTEEDIQKIVDDIVAKQPDLILNTLVDGTYALFTEALREKGITPDKIRQVSFAMTENKLAEVDTTKLDGDYVCANYFQNLDNPQNQEFVERFLARGASRFVDHPIENQYCSVHIWAMAVADAGTDEPALVREKARNQSFHGPGGVLYIDAVNRHAWRRSHIGKIKNQGRIEPIWTSDQPIRPDPFISKY